MKTKTRFFNAAQTDSTLTLLMYDAIGGGMFGDGITPQMVSAALTGDYSDVTLRLNSPGGDAFAGTAIYNVLRACGKPINVIVDGMAASAASIVAMAGDSITMAQGSVMMIHEAAGMCMGNQADMEKMALTLGIVTGSVADIYASRTGTAKKDILAMLAAETWMDPKAAVKAGFATSVSKEKAIQNSFDLSVYKHVPDEIKAQAATCACPCQDCKDGECPDCTHENCKCVGCVDCGMQMTNTADLKLLPEPEPEADDILIPILRKQLELQKRR